MQKTTIYLDDKELKELKVLAAKLTRGSAADLIRQAVREFIHTKKSRPACFAFLKKHLRKKRSPTSFHDPVSYQRSLRKEWR
ncbi:MAG: ribbon-helix-helix protein, CopG family [Deltaproteobacteria bacterium]|nr:ribbon-helix-helix protein, CopG family [Deltaproteobacteria bacterium]